ncbi:hypothetical protein [Marichromatium gracile]|uniref:Tellurite resistance protein TerB n=1 Tax=Marichromatium gracile TaxID=1048 RepID=A0ABR5VH57_MARGR|nr:hypothetical protein [Marichromatium gracile]KXX63528.1 hypothetical protein AY586_16455 [Marichromatium gracile]
MSTLELTPYPDNSAEALLRVITLFIVSDGEVADGEVEILDDLGVFETLGVDHNRFAEVFDAYCDDLIAHAGTSRYVGLNDPEWIDAVLAPVTEVSRRRLLARVLLLVARADGHFADSELAVYRRILERWEIDLDSLAEAD